MKLNSGTGQEMNHNSADPKHTWTNNMTLYILQAQALLEKHVV